MPPATPVKIPLEEPTVATEPLLLLHTPAPALPPSTVGVPGQIAALMPLIVGRLFTVTVVVTLQPEISSYVIIAVPGATPVTTPELITVATEVLLLV